MKFTLSSVCLTGLSIGVAGMLAGCSGSSSTAPSVAYLKAYNALTASTGASIVVNGHALASISQYTGSPYTSEPTGSLSSLFDDLGPGGTSLGEFTGPSLNLNNGDYYTAIVLGDLPSSAALVLATDDQTVPQSGDSRIRIVQAAPDAGNVDVWINGSVLSSTTAFKTITTYSELLAGSATISVHTSGPSTPIVPTTSFTTTAGHRYTIYITEPSTTPTYSFQVVQDS